MFGLGTKEKHNEKLERMHKKFNFISFCLNKTVFLVSKVSVLTLCDVENDLLYNFFHLKVVKHFIDKTAECNFYCLYQM